MIFDRMAKRIIGHMQRMKMDVELFVLRSKEQKSKPVYRIMLTLDEYNIIKNHITQHSLSDYEPKGSPSKSCANCKIQKCCTGELTIGSAEYCQYYRERT